MGVLEEMENTFGIRTGWKVAGLEQNGKGGSSSKKNEKTTATERGKSTEADKKLNSKGSLSSSRSDRSKSPKATVMKRKA